MIGARRNITDPSEIGHRPARADVVEPSDDKNADVFCSAQASRPHVTDDGRFNAIDSVHADDFGIRHHRHAAAACVRCRAEASTKTSPHSRIASTQHDEDALAALQSIGRRSECGAAAASNDEVYGWAH
ncbi:MAG TPA: hypothetical protein VJT13_16670 [Xanthobacteraceae bacterium]|jgi:hypothetical protein|nr:hypothetical protein [Xanthobacteraceae bacterium]